MKSIKQYLASVSSNMFSQRRCSFENILGNDDIKLILNKAILSKVPIHIILVGKPGCAKTMFLTEMMRMLKNFAILV
jgi:Holliday junction DNA helicase RuvB